MTSEGQVMDDKEALRWLEQIADHELDAEKTYPDTFDKEQKAVAYAVNAIETLAKARALLSSPRGAVGDASEVLLEVMEMLKP